MKKMKLLRYLRGVLFFSFLVFLFFGFFIAKADIIYLKTGGELEGEIIEDTPDYLTLRTKTGSIQIKKNRIRSIEKKEVRPEEIYRPQELYLFKLKEIDQTSAQDHYALGLFCLENNLLPQAEKEFRMAQQLDAAFETDVNERLKEIKKKKVKTAYQAKLIDIEINLRVPENYSRVGEAISAAKEGDVIYVSPGEYKEESGLRIGSNLTLLGAGPALTKITIGGSGLKFIDLKTGAPASNVKIENLSLNLENNPISLSYNEDIHFKKCVIAGSAITGGAVTDSQIKKSGFYITASKKIEITNCTIAGFFTGVVLGRGPADLIIRNSIMAGNIKYNLYVQDQEKVSISFTNQNIDEKELQERKEKFLSEFKDVKLVLLYNDIYGAQTNYYNCQAGPFDISVDPEFVAAPDFYLKPTSPCIDAGDPVSEFNDPDHTRADIGALPYLK